MTALHASLPGALSLEAGRENLWQSSALSTAWHQACAASRRAPGHGNVVPSSFPALTCMTPRDRWPKSEGAGAILMLATATPSLLCWLSSLPFRFRCTLTMRESSGALSETATSSFSSEWAR